MSKHVDEILELIDGALRDPSSKDAMRWSPDPKAAEPEEEHVLDAGLFEGSILLAILEDRRPLFYDRAGEPLEVEEWGRRQGDHDYCRVAVDTVGDVLVSTIWLGLDHGFLGAGPPLIFETMVADLGCVECEVIFDVWRYATEEQALAGHAVAVTQVTNNETGGDSGT